MRLSLDELEALGFIRRQVDHRDGRRAICTITRQGRQAAHAFAEKLAGPLTQAFSGLDEKELAQLDFLLRKSIQSFDKSAYL